MTHEFLSSQDTTLFCAQDPDATLQIGAVALFEATPLHDERGQLRMDDVRRHLEARLDRLPRFRQRLVLGPLGQGPPMWVDDTAFAIERHVRNVELPAPGTESQLRELVASMLEEPLDDERPLWELWVVDGVQGGRVAVIPKVSHVMADGIALLDFATSVLDFEPHNEPEAPAFRVPDEPPTPIEQTAAVVQERARRRISGSLALAATLARPDRLLGWAGSLVRAVSSGGVGAPHLAITAAVGGRRDVIWWRMPMTDLQSVKNAEGVSLNDVVLAIVAGGLRTYLEDAEQEVAGLRPRVLVPVSMHGEGDEGTENRFTFMVVDLPVATTDPIDRLRQVHTDMVGHKRSAQSSMTALLFRASDILPMQLLSTLGPPVLRRQPFVNLAVSNLPGTTEPLYLLDSRMLEMFPFINVTGNIAVIVGVLSYEDGLGVSITVDADVIDDLDALAAAIDGASSELVDAVRDAAASSRPPVLSPPSSSRAGSRSAGRSDAES